MRKPLTASKLRENLYRILDEVLETGVPVEIERRGKILKIVPMEPRSKLENLKPNPGYLRGDPEAAVHLDWSEVQEKGQSAFTRSAVEPYLKAKERQQIEARLSQTYSGEAGSLLEEVEGLLGAQAWPSD